MRMWTYGLLLGWMTISLSLFAAGDQVGPKNNRPNIILMMADDMGYGDPHYMGNREIRTDNLDAMAASGLRFQRFYSGAPVCSPTRGSCLTGRHPYRYGVWGANSGCMLSEEWTLAELLKKEGYTTGHFGKWHLGTLTKTEKDSNRGGPRGIAHYSPPWENGFDVCFSTEAKVPTWDPMIRPKNKRSSIWWDPIQDPADAVAYGTAYWSNGQKVTENLEGDDSRVIMDRAIPFIRRSCEEGKPFFAVIWFHAPHLPTVSGERYTRMYKQFDRCKQHYFGCITAMDEQIGRLRRTLREVGAAEDTMLWFCADNGPEGQARTKDWSVEKDAVKGSASKSQLPGSAGTLRGRKRSLFEGGVRVPGILEWPARISQGRISDVPASTCDYVPTVLDVLDLRMPDSRPLDGVSLKPLIEGKMTRRGKQIPFESSGRLALIGDRYKVVYDPEVKKAPRVEPNKPGRVEIDSLMLFDLVADPGEKHDIAADHPELVRKMAEEVNRFRMSCASSKAGVDYR